MNLIKCYQTHSTWYKGARVGKPVGILWHDTAGGNPYIKRYVQPYEGDADYDAMMAILGKNKYNNDWNHIEHEAGLNAWIGKLSDDSIATVQAGDWSKHAWGCGGGSLGSCNGYIKVDGKTTWTNDFWLQFEICDDGYKDEAYFKAAYKEACEFTAYICRLYGIDPNGYVLYNGVQVPTILCHADSYKLKLGGNHGDIYSWFKKFGYDMNNVRADVTKLLGVKDDTAQAAEEVVDYTVFKKDALVSIKDGATYFSGQTIPSWVKLQNWFVHEDARSSRVVINKSENGSHSIMSPIDARYLNIIHKEVATSYEQTVPDEPDKTEKTIAPESGTNNDNMPESGDNGNQDEVNEAVDTVIIADADEAKGFIIQLLNKIIGWIVHWFTNKK